MILGAADCAQYDESPGELLELALDCAKFSSLPRGGGLQGQEAGLLDKLRVLEAVYKSFHDMRYTSLDMDKWTEANEPKFTTVVRVEKMRRDKLQGKGAWLTAIQ